MVRRNALRLVFCLMLVGMLLAGSTAIGHQAPEFVEVLIGFDGNINHGILRSAGADVQHEFKYMPVVLATVPTHALRGLMNNPNIAYVEANAEVTLLQQSIPWGIDRVGAIQIHQELGITGAGVKVAVLDTGIDPNHRDLNVQGGASFISGTTWHDDHGHGTHVAGTVAALDNTVDVIGVAPDALLYAVKVLNSSGSGTFAGIAEGIEWCITNGMHVINMSLGGSSGSSALQQACDNAWNAGIVVVAAAGNSGNSSGTGENIGYPARYSSVIAVGATTSSDVRASFSSTGATLEIMAPGANVNSTRMGGGTVSYNGTSMASPHVAGVVALLMQAHPTWTNQQIRDRMNETAVTIGDGDPWKYGNGLVDAYAAIGEPVPPDPTQIQVNVATDKSNYGVGETINITVTVKDGANAVLPNANVALEIVTPNTTVTDSGTTNSNGVATFSLVTSEALGLGTYTINATASKAGYDPGFDSTSVTVADMQQLHVNVWTDRDWYYAWFDIVFMYANVTAGGNPVGGANAQFHLRTAWGNNFYENVTTNSSGNASTYFFTYPWYGYGTYTLTVTATHPSYETGVGQTTFIVQ